jgi:hypothetical protein
MPSDLEHFVATVQRRQLTTPLLLMMASHRPLAFVTGQLLFALAPLCLLLGWDAVSNWATLLSAPDAGQLLTTLIATWAEPDHA